MAYELNVAETFYANIKDLLARIDLTIHQRYELMYRYFVFAMNQKTARLSMDFSGPFARLDYLCREYQIREQQTPLYYAINAFRGRCHLLSKRGGTELKQCYSYDQKALCDFVSIIWQTPLPEDLKQQLPSKYLSRKSTKIKFGSYLRVSCEQQDESYLYLRCEDGRQLRLPWKYILWETFPVELDYLRIMARPGTQLNLVRPFLVESAQKEGDADHEILTVHAEQVIYEPDCLIDTSTVCKCFESYGNTPYTHLITRFTPSEQTRAILLGNLAGQMLDEEIHSAENDGQNRVGETVDYRETVKRFFSSYSLQIATCPDLRTPDQQKQFHADAMIQQSNIRKIVRQTFAEDRTISLPDLVLEPTFFCEMLGLQGRMDLLQRDKHVLMEQKSGKRDGMNGNHRLPHYVQVLLYQAILHYGYTDENGKALRNDDIDIYLLYSQYPNGLMKESAAPLLLTEAFRLRNQIVYLDQLCSQGKIRDILERLTPDRFNVNQLSGKLWDVYIRPRLQDTLHTIQSACKTEKDYFYRMLQFVSKEHLLGKIGNSQKEASGFSALWNSPISEKRDAGNLLDRLSIIGLDANLETVTLQLNSSVESICILPNFRLGDAVILYSYPMDSEPDARRDSVMRGVIVRMDSKEIRLGLRASQRNQSVFLFDAPVMWAIEHDFMDSSFSGLYRGLYSFLKAPVSRRNLLLTKSHPANDDSIRLIGDYGKFNPLVLKAMQAQDYFLLVGPPGTGKTSCGLVNILREQLLHSGTSILLVSYTNRAVDEICSKLEKEGCGYIRIGSKTSCSEEYRNHLLSEISKEMQSAVQLRYLLLQTRVFVGTTTAMTNNLSIFSLKRFDLCIIDEASQILEPHLLPLLSASNDGAEAIRKFVMIGDQKQLPAVVQQNSRVSAVEEESLLAIGLYDCRQSLFERLITAAPDFVYTLNAQGRMHHDVAEFANNNFYESNLIEIPLKHQLRTIPYSTLHNEDPYLDLLTHRRVSFIPVKKRELTSDALNSSDKTNPNEARIIADLVDAVHRLMAENNLPFNPTDTVGVIVPFRHQISMIYKELEKFDKPELMKISIDTVERYQGSQRDFIIYGFTVSKEYQLEFLTNNVYVDAAGNSIDRKLNVSLTRAREIQVLVGDPDVLRKDSIFCKLIDQYHIDRG